MYAVCVYVCVCVCVYVCVCCKTCVGEMIREWKGGGRKVGNIVLYRGIEIEIRCINCKLPRETW